MHPIEPVDAQPEFYCQSCGEPIAEGVVGDCVRCTFDAPQMIREVGQAMADSVGNLADSMSRLFRRRWR